MAFDSCHICRKTYQPDAMTVDMKNNQKATCFKGHFRLVVHEAVKRDSQVCFKDNHIGPEPFTLTNHVSVCISKKNKHNNGTQSSHCILVIFILFYTILISFLKQ